MDFDISVVYAVSSLVVTLVCLTCSLLSIINNSNIKVNISFSILSCIIGVWSFFSFLMFVLEGMEISLNIGRIVYIFAIFTPPALYFFIFSTLNMSNKNTKLVVSILSTISFIFLLFIPSDIFIKDIVFNNNYSCITPGPVYLAFIIYFVLTYPVSMILLIKQYRNTLSGKRKEQLRFLMLALMVAFIGACIHFIVAYRNNIENIPHNIFTGLSAMLVFYSIYKYEYLNIKMVFLKITVFVGMYFIGLGIPLYVVFMYKNWSLAFGILFIFSVIIPLLINYLQMKAEKLLFAQQNTYQQLLSKTSEEIVCKFELQEVCHIVISLIMEMIKVKFISIFVYDRDKMQYVCLDSSGQKTNTSIKFDTDDDVVTFIMTKPKSFVLDAIEEQNKQIFDIIAGDVSVIVPIKLKEKLIGFVVVGKKQDDVIYSKKELEIFDTISNQTAVAIQNVWFIQSSVKQQEKLVKTEKLAAVGGMTDGLAHQIKNRLNNFSLIGSSMSLEFDLLKKSFDNFSSKKEFIKFFDGNCAKFPQEISDNVEQTLKLLQNILGFAKPKENNLEFETFSLKQMLQQVEQLVKLKHSKYRFLLSLNIPVEDNIYAIKSQIQEVLFNFIDNAVEATIAKKEYLKRNNIEKLNKYKPEIKFSLNNFSDKWQMVIEDNGIGIKQEDKIKLFSAFFTTKTSSLSGSGSNSGSGIGIYIAKRMIVEAHNGTVIFESEYGKWTSFIITLPKTKKSMSTSTLQIK